MFDHVGVNVQNLQASKIFYEKALSALGIKTITEWAGEAVGLGINTPFFWMAQGGDGHPYSTGVHIAFVAQTREEVDTFYTNAIAAGGKDNGAPGLRTQYHPDYYAAFVYDLDGNNVEVACQKHF